MTASVSNEIAPDALRQPSASPNNVPSGTPERRAMGAPAAMASARPLGGSAATGAHSRPACPDQAARHAGQETRRAAM